MSASNQIKGTKISPEFKQLLLHLADDLKYEAETYSYEDVCLYYFHLGKSETFRELADGLEEG